MEDNSITEAQEQTLDPVPAMSTVTLDDPDGTVGLCTVTRAIMKVVEVERENGDTRKLLNWVSDCAIHIHTETRAQDDTEFIFVGSGAVDKRAVKFTIACQLPG
jgi:hypothetical protein